MRLPAVSFGCDFFAGFRAYGFCHQLIWPITFVSLLEFEFSLILVYSGYLIIDLNGRAATLPAVLRYPEEAYYVLLTGLLLSCLMSSSRESIVAVLVFLEFLWLLFKLAFRC